MADLGPYDSFPVFLPRDCEEHRPSRFTLPSIAIGYRKATMVVLLKRQLVRGQPGPA